ncbi:respiratory nitrate reductase, delta subunit NarJ [Pseudogulbenkiania sp. NH8B]|uniref:nitrate reductase molybdenum cofactor assembly chaperone n=1 Tax=Pseudogulbenkiania sp. (strain NH8B) TaxID=748280 RepID=UPI0002279ADE|nr:nitrate reductase molybdenum cofactor assembly chaperone [Pseudogulbenkiania sp. NH8B]BAK77488.1 respiratory nitrate reductase, delta subunit NarJ [Pseudogulbenkiania sp. NH8B]
MITDTPRELHALGALLTYPGPALLAALPEIGELLTPLVRRLPVESGERLRRLIEALQAGEPLSLEEDYVALFDRGRRTSLYLFEHVHGESRDRGPAMVDLHLAYARAGLSLVEGELPDYLPAVLEFLSRRPLSEANATLADCADVLRKLGQALIEKGSLYAAVPDVLLLGIRQPGLDWSCLTVQEEENLDADWESPPAFGDDASCVHKPATATVRFMPRPPR